MGCQKTKVFMGFLFGGQADNYAVNTVPKECLVRITKAVGTGFLTPHYKLASRHFKCGLGRDVGGQD